MKISRRFKIFLLGLTVLVLLWIFFQPVVWNSLVVPIAMLAWLVLRVFMSIDQKVYWGGLAFAGLLYAYFRLTQGLQFSQTPAPPETNAVLDNYRHWRETILLTQGEMKGPNFLKRNLSTLLITIIASEQENPGAMEIYEALKKGQIEVPPAVYDFLLAEPPTPPASVVGRAWQALRELPRQWRQRWGKHDLAAYYRSIEASLAFMEDYMEIEDDDFDQPRQY